jgi:hypothetical protein
MERQFNNGDFEKLLKDNANQYRMYPSEKVWKGINSALHNRRRWYGLTAIIMFLVTGSLVSMIIYGDKPGRNGAGEQKSNSIQNNNQPQAIAATSKDARAFTPAITEMKRVNRPTANLTELYITGPVFDLPSNDHLQADLNLNNQVGTNEQNIGDPAITYKTEPSENPFPEIELNLLKQNTLVKTEEDALSDLLTSEKNITEQSSVHGDTEKRINDAISALASQNISVPQPNKQAKVTAQVYFTPTVSYRKLTENYSGIDLKNVIKHKPAMGLEFGKGG